MNTLYEFMWLNYTNGLDDATNRYDWTLKMVIIRIYKGLRQNYANRSDKTIQIDMTKLYKNRCVKTIQMDLRKLW